MYKRSDQTLARNLLSETGLQFVTIFILIIAIILFGILNILGGSELAAILSGISGYILGKGGQMMSERTKVEPITKSEPKLQNDQSDIVHTIIDVEEKYLPGEDLLTN